MNRNPIVYRCDADPEQGYESFYHNLTLANAMQRRRRGAYVMGRLDPFPLASAVTRAGNEYLTASHAGGTPEDCDEVVREVRRLNAAAVVVAVPDVTEGYLKEIAATGAMVVVIAREAGSLPGRLVVNPLMGRPARHYRLESGGQALLGARYPLVRAIFRRQRPLRSSEPAQPFRALVAFGDDDPLNHTLARCKELLASSRLDKVSACVRNHHPGLEALRQTAKASDGRMEVLTEIPELATRLPRAHFALTSGDNWTMEFACVGIPQLIMSQRPHHAANGQRMDDEGAATYLGDVTQVTPTALRQSVQVLLSDPLERSGMSRCARQLVDGRGPDRLVNGIEILLHGQSIPEAERVAA